VTHYYRGDRYYEEDELLLFASYREYRAQQRPTTCRGGEVCWVEDGPPAIDKVNGRTRCRGCGGTPLSLCRGARKQDYISGN